MTQPLVSILIPVIGNPAYLELALTSALLQTYTNIEIIIRDPSPTNEIQLLLEKSYLPFSNKITYIKEFQYTSKPQAFQKMINYANGDYINFLLEKDLFYPTKIEKMLNYFTDDSSKNIKLVTSLSEKIDMHGNLFSNDLSKEIMCEEDLRLDGLSSGGLILKNRNYISGLSTPLFKKRDLIEPFGHFAQQDFKQEPELASWLTLLSQGSFVLVADKLIFERLDKNITFKKSNLLLIADWIHLIRLGKQYGFLRSLTVKNTIICQVSKWINTLLLDQQKILTLEERYELFEYKNFLESFQINP
ncbi:glycosyltransferase family 2 protein [Bacillus wiedmannii]|nr:glycosyltransferase [Bacillus wiedmannii]